MIVSEAEAITKWCPHIRVARSEPVDPSVNINAPGNATVVAGCNSDALGRNRVPGSCRCIGSGCMAWRWAGWHNTRFGTVAPVPPAEHRRGDRLGYCGLAGRGSDPIFPQSEVEP